MKLIKVKNFPDRMTAEQAQLRLKEEGIESLIQSQAVGMFGSFGVGTPVGVDLYVREEQEKEARKVLDDLIGDV
jgi:hypothetical protein